jgi:hypothetical protein
VRRAFAALAALLALAAFAPPALAQTITAPVGCVTGVACQASTLAVGGSLAAGDTVAVNIGTVTGTQRAIDITGTYNSSGFVFGAPLFMNMQCTLCAGNALLFDLQSSVNGQSSKFSVDVAGRITGGSGITLAGGTLIGAATCHVWSARSQICSPANGQVQFLNNGSTATASIIGTATNDNAVATGIGEYICAQVTNGGSPAGCATNSSTPVSLTTATAATVASISLTAGDWDVWATECLNVGAGATPSAWTASINTTPAVQATPPGAGAYFVNVTGFVVAQPQCEVVGYTRASLSATTTEYLVATSSFAGGTVSAYGYLAARRAR